MPHKRNPEGSEHLDTLARLVRANAAVLLEGMVGGHERDGRGWKAEWVALPEVCLLTGVALAAWRGRCWPGWRSTSSAMRANLERLGDQLASEQVLAGLTPRLGKHAAQQLMHDVLAPGRGGVRDVVDALRRARASRRGRPSRARRTAGRSGDAAAMVDAVVARGRLARADGAERMGVTPRAGPAGLPADAAACAAPRLDRDRSAAGRCWSSVTT